MNDKQQSMNAAPQTKDAISKITGHDLMDISRFRKGTRHMIVFDVLTAECPVGEEGQRVRLFLTDVGYKNALESERRGEMSIVRHALVNMGNIQDNMPRDNY